jgi:hypothetical protein
MHQDLVEVTQHRFSRFLYDIDSHNAILLLLRNAEKLWKSRDFFSELWEKCVYRDLHLFFCRPQRESE